NYQTGECHGACLSVEDTEVYNTRAAEAIMAAINRGNNAAIIGQGRNVDEQSIILVENGSYRGFGFFDKTASVTDFESARLFVKSGVETPTVQNLINSYLTNPRGARVVTF